MQYRSMGKKIDWKGSALGFGAMRLPRKNFLFLKNFQVDEEESKKIIRYAIDNGVNYVDTAYYYMMKRSEIAVGKALKDGYREKVHLVTKCPMGKMKKTEDFDKTLNEQLQKLQTNYLDIYLLHSLNKKNFEKVKSLGLIKKMEEAKASGKIKHIGFSFHDSLDVFKQIIDYYDWDVCQIQYNYMDAAMNFQAGTEGLKYAASKGIGVIIMEPLRGGRLANPTDEIKEIINNSPIKRTAVDWALQFLWDKPEVSVVLSGMGSLQMVKENVESANNSGIGKLMKEEHEILDKMAMIYQKNILISCTKCNYCLEVCDNGVNIPEIFELVNNYSQNPNDKKIQKRYKKLVKKSEKVDKSKHNGAPNVCKKCMKCMAECPQKINIPEMLDKALQVLENHQSIKEVFSQK